MSSTITTTKFQTSADGPWGAAILTTRLPQLCGKVLTKETWIRVCRARTAAVTMVADNAREPVKIPSITATAIMLSCRPVSPHHPRTRISISSITWSSTLINSQQRVRARKVCSSRTWWMTWMLLSAEMDSLYSPDRFHLQHLLWSTNLQSPILSSCAPPSACSTNLKNWSSISLPTCSSSFKRMLEMAMWSLQLIRELSIKVSFPALKLKLKQLLVEVVVLT